MGSSWIRKVWAVVLELTFAPLVLVAAAVSVIAYGVAYDIGVRVLAGAVVGSVVMYLVWGMLLLLRLVGFGVGGSRAASDTRIEHAAAICGGMAGILTVLWTFLRSL